MTDTTVRIVIADDHSTVRDALKRVLESEPRYRVVGEAKTGRDAIHATRAHRPEVLLFDISMPELSRIRSILSQERLFVVVQDIFPTETTALADVVLPAAGWGEKTGVITNAAGAVIKKPRVKRYETRIGAELISQTGPQTCE